MAADLRKTALALGYLEARPVTGHPFMVWRDRLKELPLGEYLSFEHDPVRASGWPLEEITLWVATAATPPMAEWPEGGGEIGAYYMRSHLYDERKRAWEDAARGMGLEVAEGYHLPERAAAIRAGLGVHGLNGLMITPEHGSFVDITILLVHEAPSPDARGPEHDLSPGCSRCGACIEACPVGAISEDGMNAVICLRNYISRPQMMPEDDYPKMGRRIQGCDTCQRACPHNAHLECAAPPEDMIKAMRLEGLLTSPDLESISRYIRTSYAAENRIKTQAALTAVNTGRKDLLPLVEALIGSDDEGLDKIARWSAERLRRI